MGTFYSKPTRNPDNGTLTADEVELSKEGVPSPTEGAIGLAFDLVKQRPLETIVLSVLSIFTGGGGGGCNIPSDLGDLFDDDEGSSFEDSMDMIDSPTASDPSFDFGSWIADSIHSVSPDLAGAIGATEIGLIVFVLMFVVGISLVLYALNTLVEGGGSIFWLRLVRNQEASLNHITDVKKFFLPLFITPIIVGFGAAFGTLLLIVPGIIAVLGWSLIRLVIVDKNLTYFEAIKASWRMTSGYKIDLLIFFILLFLVNIAGLLVCCVGIFVTHAVSMGAIAIVYDRLAAPGNAYMDGPGYEDVFE